MELLNALYDHELEKIVLGALILEKEALNRVIIDFGAHLFNDEKHKIVAKAMLKIHLENNDIDIMTTTLKVKEMGMLETVSAFYISSLTDRVATSANIELHIKILQEFHVKRSCNSLGYKISKMTQDFNSDPFELIDGSIKELEGIQNLIITKQFDTISKLTVPFLEEMESIRIGNGRTGIKYGLRNLDKITGGAYNTDLIIIAARPAMGKTALMLKIARNCALSLNKPCLLFSLEMSSEQLLSRIVSAECRIDSNKFRTGEINNYDINIVSEKLKQISENPLYIDDTGALNIYDLINRSRKAKRENNIEMIIVDYLQLITCSEYRNDKTNQTTFVSGQLKKLAKELNIPVIALSQLSREVEKRSDKRPQLSDLRDSGAIEQDADQVFFIYRPEYYGIDEIEMNGTVINSSKKSFIDVAKNRHGNTGIDLYGFAGEFTEFFDVNNF